MDTWVVSLMMKKSENGLIAFRLAMSHVKATSEDEAVGKAVTGQLEAMPDYSVAQTLAVNVSELEETEEDT